MQSDTIDAGPLTSPIIQDFNNKNAKIHVQIPHRRVHRETLDVVWAKQVVLEICEMEEGPSLGDQRAILDKGRPRREIASVLLQVVPSIHGTPQSHPAGSLFWIICNLPGDVINGDRVNANAFRGTDAYLGLVTQKGPASTTMKIVA